MLGAGLCGVEGGLGRVGGRGAAQLRLSSHHPGTGPAGVHLYRDSSGIREYRHDLTWTVTQAETIRRIRVKRKRMESQFAVAQ